MDWKNRTVNRYDWTNDEDYFRGNIYCYGNETDIMDCRHSWPWSDCDHESGAGVVCTGLGKNKYGYCKEFLIFAHNYFKNNTLYTIL